MAWTSPRSGHTYVSVNEGVFTDPTRLYIDLHRRPPIPWTPIRTVDDLHATVRLVSPRRLNVVSLDYAFADGQTGIDMLQYLKGRDMLPRKLYFHAADPAQLAELIEYADMYLPGGVLCGYGANFWGTEFGPIQRVELDT